MRIQTTGKILDYQQSPVIGRKLTLTVGDDLAEQLDQLHGQKVRIEIKSWNDSKKRSRNANAYMWTLLTKLQNAGFGNAEENYKKYIREFGHSEAYAVPQAAFPFYRRTFESSGIGYQIQKTGEESWTNEWGEDVKMVEFVQYFGSHTYTKEQMSHLLEPIVQDCKAVGISTETPEEQERLIEEWQS